MIDGADFLKWLEIFQVNFGGGGGAVDLQQAYDNGLTANINFSDSRSISFTTIKDNIYFNDLITDDSSIMNVSSTSRGIKIFPQLTQAEIDLIPSLSESLALYNKTTKNINYFDGSTFQSLLTVDDLIPGTDITILNNGDGTATISSSGSGLLGGGYAVFSITPNPITNMVNSAYLPINMSVALSSSSNINVNNDGSIEILSDGTYDFEYVMTALSTAATNNFSLALAIDGSVFLNSLQTVRLSTGDLNTAGTSIVLKYTFSLVAGQVVRPYISNIGTIGTFFQLIHLVGSVNQNLASSATLQQAYDNGNGGLQGNQTTKPFFVKNSGGTALLTFTESAGSLTGNASTATILQTARNINGVSFNGSADITITAEPSGSAGGDLSSSYPNPTVSKINGSSLGSTTPTAGNLLIGSGTAWVTNPVTGDITISSSGVTAIGASKVTNTMLAGSIDDSKLNTISTAGKVSNSATTAASANTANSIVSRDASGDFSAGTITAALIGNASTTTALQTARTIGGVSFDGTANIVPQTIQSIDDSSDTTCFPLFINSSGTQSLQPKNNANFTYNASANTMAFAGLTLNNNGSALSSTNSILSFPSTLGIGNLINYEGFGYSGVSTSNKIFIAKNLVFDSTAVAYKYINAISAGAGLIELSTAGVSLMSAPIGSAGSTATPVTVLTANSSGQLLFPNLTASTVLNLNSSNVLIATALTNGQFLIGSTGADPVAATITAGNGISITNGAGSITIASTGNPPYTEVTGISQSMAVNNEYTANNAGLVTLTLPSTAAIGDQVTVNGKGAGGWLIAQNSGQLIHLGSSVTTTGVGGSLASTNQWDTIKLKCVTANTTWIVQTVIGNITVI